MKFLAGDEKRFFDFMSRLDEKDKIAIIGHHDGDGVGCAIIASKVVGKPELVYFYDYLPEQFLFMFNEIKKKKINKIFLLDLSLPEPDLLKLGKLAEILVIDHHPFEKDLNSDRIVFIKSDSGAACYVCYYLFSKIQKIPEWIAALGTLSDVTYKYSEDMMDEFFRDFGFSRIDNLWEKTFDLIFALVYFDGKTKTIYDLLMEAKDFSELGIEKYANIVKKEYENIISKFDKEKEVYGDLIFYYFEPKYGIKSMIINKISAENPRKTFIFVQKLSGDEEGFEISSRRQDGKINCPELLRKSLRGISNSNSGGHFRAAGGRIPLGYLAKFKENLIREYKKLAG